ncbi:MAG: glycosyltransferase family 2 protein [Chitinispirillales bacterium]|jgi:glycosyltransferase involved in cell wall biosynthesis|nr:glycosyltransferase family 2 protein [Chitinispirillales bacterium]
MNANKPILSIVVPCFNEEEVLPIFYNEIRKVFDESLAKEVDYEIVFVDDGSCDKTAEIIKFLSQDNEKIKYMIFSRNFGKEAAMFAGLQKANGDFIVTIDADLQDPPGLLPQMLEAVKYGQFDCAGSRRVSRKGEPPIRSFFARIFYKIITKLSDTYVVDGARDFRLMNKKYVNAILSLGEYNRFSKGIFPWVGFKVKWFEYENIERAAGETKWSFWKLFFYSLEGIISFSIKPLHLASILGIGIFVFSVLLFAFMIVRKFIAGLPDTGWSSIICLQLFIGGIQLFTVGILGEYLAKIHQEVKKRPHFIVDGEK